MIPLISDTETQPTPAMREVMASAEVGDEQKGEDPTVNRLLAQTAALLGQEAALWLPGGTMCNMIAIKVHTRPGDVVFADTMSHIFRAESGGAAITSSVMLEPVDSERGIFTAKQLDEARARAQACPEPYAAPLGLVCVEQTHNFGGGFVWTEDQLTSVAGAAKTLGMPIHMDGARLLNAAVASGVPASRFGGLMDSVWIDFTKGLGAPIGAVLAGNQSFVDQARRYKQAFGGAMRQAGIAAAGCLHALEHHVERLAEDHRNARVLAQALAGMPGVVVTNPQPETNMVFFRVDPGLISHGELIDTLAQRGVALGDAGAEIRAVTHLDVTSETLALAVDKIRDVLTAAEARVA
ncbi:MAG: GntG family PLP-dependent aldolase [Pseudomonadota bacterium]